MFLRNRLGLARNHIRHQTREKFVNMSVSDFANALQCVQDRQKRTGTTALGAHDALVRKLLAILVDATMTSLLTVSTFAGLVLVTQRTYLAMSL